MNFFLTLSVRGLVHRKDLCEEKKSRGAGLISEKTEDLFPELYRRAEAATSSYSSTGDFLQCIYSVFEPKNHQKV